MARLRELTDRESTKLATLLAGEAGVLLSVALGAELLRLADEFDALVMDNGKSDDVACTEFTELRRRGDHIRWAREWLEQAGVVPAVSPAE